MKIIIAAIGPLAGVVTLLSGQGEDIPLPYLITAACVTAVVVTWMAIQLYSR